MICGDESCGNSSLVIKFTEKHDKNMKLITKHTRTHKVVVVVAAAVVLVVVMVIVVVVAEAVVVVVVVVVVAVHS